MKDAPKMVKVVRIPLLCEQTDKDGNPVDYKTVNDILWGLQKQTREIKNKTVQYCWEYYNFSNDYYKKNGDYPKEKDILGYSLSGYVNNKFKHGYDLYSANSSSTSRDVCTAFNNAKKEMLNGDRSVLSYKANQPLDLYYKSIKITSDENSDFYVELNLLNRLSCKKNNFANTQIKFKLSIKDKSTKTIVERCIDGVYDICGSKLLYNQKKKMWELNLSYKIKTKKAENLDEQKILGVDLGIACPIVASVNGDFKCLKIDKGEIEHFRKSVEARKISLLRQTKYCGDGRIGHGIKTRCKPAFKIEDKIARFRDTVNHKYSRAVIDFAVKNGCGTIQMENLSGITKDKNKFLKNWSYFDLQTKIEYKAKEAGIKVVYIDPKYTSQRCSRCGFIAKENRPEQSVFICQKCGFNTNADYNASQNIAIRDIDKIIKDELANVSQT